eukprot:10733724-Alexandrium_andersonii.AAC.1
MFRRQIAHHRLSMSGSGRRQLDPGVENLVQTKAHSKRHKRRKRDKPMCFGAFKAYKQKPEHGGYGDQAVMEHWKELTNGKTHVDDKGVENGVKGKKRWGRGGN